MYHERVLARATPFRYENMCYLFKHHSSDTDVKLNVFIDEVRFNFRDREHTAEKNVKYS